MKIMSLNHISTGFMLLVMPNPVAVSFEFFPPGDDAMARQLLDAVKRLAPLQPHFVSVTYGADGSTRARTHECVLRILRETDLRVAPHLTCVAASRDAVLGLAREYWDEGVRHLVALRGDVPASHRSADGRYQPQADGFAFASDLVGGLKGAGSFDISVAAYPEGHPESGTVDADLENLNARSMRAPPRNHSVLLRHRCFSALSRSVCGGWNTREHRAGNSADHALSANAALRGALRHFGAGVAVPPVRWLDEDPETRRMIAANVAIEQVRRLRQHGVEEFHFYTLNRAELTFAICHALGLRPHDEAQVA